MERLLQEFVETVPEVTHALLLSRDALALVSSGTATRDWVDKWAATLGGLASLAENVPGPLGGAAPLKLVLVEREDALILVSIAGSSGSGVFPNRPGASAGTVDTVLAVIASPSANAGTVGFEMGRLIDAFAPYMLTAVRTD
ncbi:roadblock/LC7 domain-containing protein [Streptomyces griseoviridis]|uniref:Roadblock/LC7 domain-containing protein n=1 Tax=Streptomyces griseoviridis TaxID=45398 RepID=A0A3S9ZR41_STRGD|nr:roadblock/LC7 domain-containing protein [Streptomyces griseoviridis]QCN90539.1 hypothetical protein DDJ31_13565 [Streptomyces griseoviridis]